MKPPFRNARNPSLPEAKRHFKEESYKWRSSQRAFFGKVRTIDDPLLRWAVTTSINAIILGRAAFYIRGAAGHKTHLRVTNIDIDDDVCDFIENVLEDAGIEDPVGFHNEAGQWILKTLTDSSLAFLAWCFIHLTFEAGERVNVTCGRVVYNPAKAQFLGVLTKYDDKVIVPHHLLTAPLSGIRSTPKWILTPSLPVVEPLAQAL